MWKDKVVSPQEVLSHIEPGMAIFLGTGMAEPRTLVKNLMASEEPNLQDLELIQLVSIGDTIPIDENFVSGHFFPVGLPPKQSAKDVLTLFPVDFQEYPLCLNQGLFTLTLPSFKFHRLMKTAMLVWSAWMWKDRRWKQLIWLLVRLTQKRPALWATHWFM